MLSSVSPEEITVFSSAFQTAKAFLSSAVGSQVLAAGNIHIFSFSAHKMQLIRRHMATIPNFL